MGKGNHTTLIKSDLVTAVYQEVGLPKSESTQLIESVFSMIEEALVSGETVKLPGFGNFVPIMKPERVGRNPKNGEEVIIAPRRIVSFKASKKLKDRINRALTQDKPDPSDPSGKGRASMRTIPKYMENTPSVSPKNALGSKTAALSRLAFHLDCPIESVAFLFNDAQLEVANDSALLIPNHRKVFL